MEQKTDFNTVVIGGGQAGIATSEHLSKHGISHVVLEKNRIAERWRSQRWDSLVGNSPAWHDRFPGLKFEKFNDDDFVPKEDIADYFVAYVEKFNLPIREGVEVKKVTRRHGQAGFSIETSDRTLTARHIVSATGPFQKPVIPPVIPTDAPINQIHSTEYFNPQHLPDGGVLVVGAGSSGTQIADELCKAGRDVYLSVGAHTRPPRSYRDRDFCWWLGVLGVWNATAPAPGTEHMATPVSGDYGKDGTVDFRKMAHAGVTLVGRTDKYADGKIHFKDDLQDNIRVGDESYFNMLNAMDDYVQKNGLDLPEQPHARTILPDPDCLTHPLSHVHIQDVNITSIIWATGFQFDYDWLDVDTFDEHGHPKHHRGIGAESGVYFVGLPYLSRTGSAFIWGCWYDAKYIAEQIALNDKYNSYPNS